MSGFDWESRIASLPEKPGVYLMKGHDDEILYIGKAKSLKQRVRQYFTESGDPRPFVRKLPGLLKTIDILLAGSEQEALLLEATLIKKHHPRFNILLKEGHRYLCLRLNLKTPWPRLEVIRRRPQNVSSGLDERVFGPFHSSFALRRTLDVINRWFHLRTCDDREFRNRSRPCLEYQIKRCPGPCCLPVSREDYDNNIQEVILFLEGKHTQLLEKVETRMWEASNQFAFEMAARYRDQKEAITTVLQEQEQNQTASKHDRDVFGYYREGSDVEIQLMLVRRGQLSGGQSFSFENQEFDDVEIFQDFLTFYYLEAAPDYPREVLLPDSLAGLEEQDETQLLSEVLKDRIGRKIQFKLAQRGEPKRLVELATQNAEQGFLERQRTEAASQERLQKIQRRLGLSRLPYRIECVDNSHMQGRYAVSAVVVFEGGFPNRSSYRRYHLSDEVAGDDFGSMKEVLKRRFKGSSAKTMQLPDLLLIDGGRGQLNMARAALEDLGLDGIELAAIAKQRHDPTADGPISQQDETDRAQDLDRIFTLDRKNPIPVHQRHGELFLLSRLRDEAHKTAITFHQKTREKKKLQSILLDITGIGERKKNKLLKHFGTLQKVEKATQEQLEEVDGITPVLAQRIIAFFAKRKAATKAAKTRKKPKRKQGFRRRNRT